MAGPLSGLTGQTTPLSNPFQPGQNAAQVRTQEDQKPQDNRVQPKNAAAAGSQESQNSRRETSRTDEDSKSLALQDPSKARRGSLVDLSV